MGKLVRFFLETANKIEPKLIMSGLWMVPCKLGVITRIENLRWLLQQFLTYGKMNNSFFLDGLLQGLNFLCESEIQDDCQCRT